MSKFVSKDQQQEIIQAIQQAESNTSGEIRVHVQRTLKGSILETAQQAFFRLKMHETAQRNGVLFFIVPEKRQFAILGDQGINERVPDHFWDDIRDLMRGHFKQGAFSAGLCAGIERVGEKLKAYFPVEAENPNELSDEISFDDTE